MAHSFLLRGAYSPQARSLYAGARAIEPLTLTGQITEKVADDGKPGFIPASVSGGIAAANKAEAFSF